MRPLVLATLFALAASAELPEYYKQVNRIVFVVPDLDKALAGWNQSGLVKVLGSDTAEATAEYRGREVQTRVRFAAGWFGDVLANWMQPLSGNDALADYFKRHGAGVFALIHNVPSPEALDAEVARMKGLGVKVLQRGNLDDRGSRYVFFDTEPQGKYVLGLMYMPRTVGAPAGARKVTQFAFIIRDEAPVSEYWSLLGWPEMSVTHPKLHALEYRGKPAEYASRLGWMRHGAVPYEWIVPEKGPSAWHAHLDKHGESFHHLAVQVENMDEAIADWEKRGFVNAMAGAWGETGNPGFGRFAYIDTQAAGGIDVELLWNYRAAK